MTNRIEFSRKTRALGLVRAGGKCEACHAQLHPGRFQFHHVVEANDGGDGSLGNMQVLCTPCHAPLTKAYTQALRKAERIRDKATGAWVGSGRKLPGSRNGPVKIKMNGTVVQREVRR